MNTTKGMLIRFVVTNFLSFNEETEFNMLPSENVESHKHHIYEYNDLNILRCAAIYGANGAGKTNLVDALNMMQGFIKEGRLGIRLDERKFKLSKENSSKPSSMELEIFIEGKAYAYGISFSNNIVLAEWLYLSFPENENGLIFERTTEEKKVKIKTKDDFYILDSNQALITALEENIVKPDELLIGKHDILKIPEVTNVWEWITENILILYPHSRFRLASRFHNKEFRDYIGAELNDLDTGVKGFDIKEEEQSLNDMDEDLYKILKDMTEDDIISPHIRTDVFYTRKENKFFQNQIVSHHLSDKGEKVEFKLYEESDGTNRLIDILPAVRGFIEQGVTVIIDEIDQSIHTILLSSYIKEVMNNENVNGQFIFTTHESNLLNLDMLRADEIWFVEKDRNKGSSHLYPLSDFQPKPDLDINKGYLNGRFGAIPFITTLPNIKLEQDDV